MVYRGTGDGEWLDNGLGMTQASTRQQEEAARYFDYVVEHNGLNGSDDITVTGHSKGGNKSQYVTVNSEYKDYIDQCISWMDRAFPQAIAAFKEKYGEEPTRHTWRKCIRSVGKRLCNPLGVKIILDGTPTT
ncbi:MAG: Mbeg1-like protein [Hydrogeniiclostridium mannosilyticum]